MEADKVALGIDHRRPRLLEDEIWRFERRLRVLEYAINCKRSRFWKPYRYYLWVRCRRLGMRLGYTIPPNVFGPGLRIAHRGTIIVSHSARIGENFSLQAEVIIGVKSFLDDGAPQIGNNVFVGAGTVVIGGIRIADDIAISAMSLVNKSFTDPGITVGGIPASKIGNRGSEEIVTRATEIVRKKQKRY